ncbi:nitrate assimilation regulatory protein nirA [Macrophomina phaseolina MS6]|uniref:Nitrate assimilation regulatory protein nirA n=1 Tax=Macrophomina phaseolina (strain MS6) TaxID=1126212 RepID=K2R5D8_MACPH|nr:nitrate assimilation regulatory protein nirA [Macrophomina phaseolina MS6]
MAAVKARNEALQADVNTLRAALLALQTTSLSEASQPCTNITADDNSDGLITDPDPLDALFTASIDNSKPLPPVKPITSLQLPDALKCKRSVLAFFRCSGSLFHIFKPDDGIALFNQVYAVGSVPSRATLSELFAIAAIGSHYENTSMAWDSCEAFFTLARLYFDDVIDACPLRGMRVSVLLAMWNIMCKHTVALAYIETGLALAEASNVRGQLRPLSIDDDSWVNYKGVFNTLMFLEHWISATTGHVRASGRCQAMFQVFILF